VQADALLSAWTPARGLLRGVMNTSLDLAGDGTRPEDCGARSPRSGWRRCSTDSSAPAPRWPRWPRWRACRRWRRRASRTCGCRSRSSAGASPRARWNIPTAAGDWKVSGSVGFDGSLDYAVSITVPREQAARLGADAALAAGALSDAQGRVLLDLRVGGTAKARRWRGTRVPRATGWPGRCRARSPSSARASRTTCARARAGACSRWRRTARAEAAGAPPAVTADSLRSRAKDLLRGFFGVPPAAPPAAPAPPSADSSGR